MDSSPTVSRDGACLSSVSILRGLRPPFVTVFPVLSRRTRQLRDQEVTGRDDPADRSQAGRRVFFFLGQREKAYFAKQPALECMCHLQLWHTDVQSFAITILKASSSYHGEEGFWVKSNGIGRGAACSY